MCWICNPSRGYSDPMVYDIGPVLAHRLIWSIFYFPFVRQWLSFPVQLSPCTPLWDRLDFWFATQFLFLWCVLLKLAKIEKIEILGLLGTCNLLCTNVIKYLSYHTSVGDSLTKNSVFFNGLVKSPSSYSHRKWPSPIAESVGENVSVSRFFFHARFRTIPVLILYSSIISAPSGNLYRIFRTSFWMIDDFSALFR